MEHHGELHAGHHVEQHVETVEKTTWNTTRHTTKYQHVEHCGIPRSTTWNTAEHRRTSLGTIRGTPRGTPRGIPRGTPYRRRAAERAGFRALPRPASASLAPRQGPLQRSRKDPAKWRAAGHRGGAAEASEAGARQSTPSVTTDHSKNSIPEIVISRTMIPSIQTT